MSSLTDTDSWILDSGVSNHMIDRKEFFSTFEDLLEESFVRLGNNVKLSMWNNQRKKKNKDPKINRR